MEPLLFFAVMVALVIALGVRNGRRRSALARGIFTPLARELGGRVTAPKLGTPSLRFPVSAGEARMSLLRQKGTEVTTEHLRLRVPLALAPGEATRIRTKPTRVVHMQGGEVLSGTGLPDRWHVQSTDPARARSLLEGEVRRLLAEVEDDRRVAVEVRDRGVTIRWGQPIDVVSARRLLALGNAVTEKLEALADSGARPSGPLS